MKKKYIAMLLLLTSVLTLSACTKDSTSSSATGSSDTNSVPKVSEAPASEQESPSEDTDSSESQQEPSPEATQDPSDTSLENQDTAKEIPVLMGGALPYTNMKTIKNENYEDGTYRYEDVTEDGKLQIINYAFSNPSTLPQTPEEYGAVAAEALSDSGTYDNLSSYQDETYTNSLSYPVYLVSFTTGANEDTRNWLVFMTETDNYTYLYALSQSTDAEDDLDEIGQDLFPRLFLSDVAS